MIGFARAAAYAVAMTSLVACAGTQSSNAPGSLGSADPSAAFVAEVFDTVCLKTRPSYAGAVEALAALGFTQAGTGTYYDGRNNLSVKLLGKPATECSVVWGVRGDAVAHVKDYRDAMQAREPLDLSTSSFRPSAALDGVQYFNTRSTAN